MPVPRWLDPRRTFGTRLTIIIVSLVLLTLATATLVTLRVARASLTDQVGDNFQGQAESVSDIPLALPILLQKARFFGKADSPIDVCLPERTQLGKFEHGPFPLD